MTNLRSLIETKSRARAVSCDAAALRAWLGYDVATMRANGYDPSIVEEHQAFNAKLEEFLTHPVIGAYLASLTPEEIYLASHVRVLPLGAIRDEITHLAPGARLFHYDYLPFATSIGGHALCFHAPTNRVVWADHESFSCEDSIDYKDRHTGDWHTVPFTGENIERAVVPLANDIRAFLADLLHDRLGGQLDDLDLGRAV
jgi:hypothetical protein